MKLTTERAVRDALSAYFDAPAYAVLPGVADGTGRHKSRTVDAVVASLWPSRGLWIAGVEIKVSRSDLVRELRDPAKQESVFRFCDYFWLAVGDESIVRDGDVPETWGLLVPGRAGKLKVVKEAPKLEAQPMSPAFRAAILRRAAEQITTLRKDLAEEAREAARGQVADELERLRAELDEQRRLASSMRNAELVDRFATRAGISFDRWNQAAVDEAADLVRLLGSSPVSDLLRSARYSAEGARRTATQMLRNAEELLAGIEQLEAQPKVTAQEPASEAPKTEPPSSTSTP